MIEALVAQALRNVRYQEWETEAEKMYAEAFRQPEYASERAELAEAFAAADAEVAERLDS